MAVQELLRVTASGTFTGGDIWQNVWHVDWDQTNAPISEAEAQTLSNQFDTFYTTVAADLWSVKCQLVSISVQDLNFTGLIPWEFPHSVTGPPVDTIPQICCCVATLRNAGQGDPSERGRIFLPMNGVDALGVNGGIVSSVRDTVVDAVAQLSLDLDANTDSRGVVIFSRKLQTWLQCTQVSCDNLVAVQRGRQNAVLREQTVKAVVFGT